MARYDPYAYRREQVALNRGRGDDAGTDSYAFGLGGQPAGFGRWGGGMDDDRVSGYWNPDSGTLTDFAPGGPSATGIQRGSGIPLEPIISFADKIIGPQAAGQLLQELDWANFGGGKNYEQAVAERDPKVQEYWDTIEKINTAWAPQYEKFAPKGDFLTNFKEGLLPFLAMSAGGYGLASGLGSLLGGAAGGAGGASGAIDAFGVDVPGNVGSWYDALGSGGEIGLSGALGGAAPVTEGAWQMNPGAAGTEAAAAPVYEGQWSMNPGAGAIQGGSALGRLLGLGQTGQDALSVLGQFGAPILGYLGAQDKVNAQSDVANKYLELGAPARSRLEASYAPGFSMTNEPGYKDALNQTMESFLRKSSTGGNPFDNPGVSTEILKNVNAGLALPALQNYRSQLGTFGQLGTNTAGAADMGAAASSGGTYNALGYGLDQLTAQPSGLQQLLKELQAKGYGLTDTRRDSV